MSVPRPPKPAKLVISLFLREKHLISPVAKDLADTLGSMDMVSFWFEFDFTSYYETEMGKPLYRRILTLQSLIEQEDLADIKLATNEIERKYSENGKRRVNIDPGYMVPARFVLATGKDYAHRVYIGKRIYADVTLIYQQGQFQVLPWTYPDYAADVMRDYLDRVRNQYMAGLKRCPLGPKNSKVFLNEWHRQRGAQIITTQESSND